MSYKVWVEKTGARYRIWANAKLIGEAWKTPTGGQKTPWKLRIDRVYFRADGSPTRVGGKTTTAVPLLRDVAPKAQQILQLLDEKEPLP